MSHLGRNVWSTANRLGAFCSCSYSIIKVHMHVRNVHHSQSTLFSWSLPSLVRPTFQYLGNILSQVPQFVFLRTETKLMADRVRVSVVPPDWVYYRIHHFMNCPSAHIRLLKTFFDTVSCCNAIQDQLGRLARHWSLEFGNYLVTDLARKVKSSSLREH